MRGVDRIVRSNDLARVKIDGLLSDALDSLRRIVHDLSRNLFVV